MCTRDDIVSTSFPEIHLFLKRAQRWESCDMPCPHLLTAVGPHVVFWPSLITHLRPIKQEALSEWKESFRHRILVLYSPSSRSDRDHLGSLI